MHAGSTSASCAWLPELGGLLGSGSAGAAAQDVQPAPVAEASSAEVVAGSQPAGSTAWNLQLLVSSSFCACLCCSIQRACLLVSLLSWATMHAHSFCAALQDAGVRLEADNRLPQGGVAADADGSLAAALLLGSLCWAGDAATVTQVSLF